MAGTQLGAEFGRGDAAADTPVAAFGIGAAVTTGRGCAAARGASREHPQSEKRAGINQRTRGTEQIVVDTAQL